MTKPAWADEANYTYTKTLPDEGWAWEFLRRNKRYRSDWKELQARIAELEEKYGPEWRRHEEALVCEPERLPGETMREWKSRGLDAPGIWWPFPIREYYGWKWRLAGDMLDPDIRFDQITDRVRLWRTSDYPVEIEDSISFEDFSSDLDRSTGDELPYREVLRPHLVLAFSVAEPFDAQAKNAAKLFQKAKKRWKKFEDGAKEKRKHHEKDTWPRFLKALDAHLCGASYFVIARSLKLPLEDREQAKSNGKSLVQNAERQAYKYASIIPVNQKPT